MPQSHPWYLTFKPRPAAQVRLYCFPCAGSGPSMYRQWAEQLPEWVELRAVRLPGRQGRHREAAFTDADTAVRALLDGLAGELTGTYVFFGHSMGALLAYRMTGELVRADVGQGITGPRLLAVASWPPAGAPRASMPDPSASDDCFAEAALQLGGVPEELFANVELLRYTLPLLRADFMLCHSYIYRPAPPLPLPVIAFGGADDRVIPPELMAGWQQESLNYLGLHLFPGGHFFLHDQGPELSRLIVETATKTI